MDKRKINKKLSLIKTALNPYYDNYDYLIKQIVEILDEIINSE